MDDQRPLIVNCSPADKDDPENNGSVDAISNAGCSIPCRYVLVVLMSIGFFCSFAQRMVFNIALVAMVNLADEAENKTSNNCPAEPHAVNTTAVPQSGEFDWSPSLQGILLGAFFYGYPLSQLPFGYLAERFGGKYIFAFNGLSTGVLSMLIPVVARWNPYALVVVRAVQGLCQGSIYPTCVAMWSRWGAPDERNKMYSIVNSGATLGSVVAMAASGVMCQSTFLGGWPSTFYLFGGLSVLWSFCWLAFVYDTPAVHPRITAAELNYITKETDGLHSVKYSLPNLRSVVTSVPVWAVFIITCTDNFGFYITFSCMPIFMKQVLHFDMSQDGVVSALPYLVQFPVSLAVGIVADAIRRKGWLRVINIRRGSAIIGEFLPAVFILLAGFVGCNQVAAVAMLMLSLGSNAVLLAGPIPSLFDIAPLYAGSLLGILNGIGNIFGIIAPIAVAQITHNSGDQIRWRTVFCLSAAIYAFGTIVFCIFVSDKEQSWSRPKEDNEETEENDIHAPLPIPVST